MSSSSQKTPSYKVLLELYNRQNELLQQETSRADKAEEELVITKQQKEALEKEMLVLLKRIAELRVEIANATNRSVQKGLQLELKVLHERLEKFANDEFATSKSEKRKKRKKEKKKPKRPTRKPKQNHFPVTPIPHLLEGEECTCSHCNVPLHEIPDQVTEHDIVVSIQRSYFINRHQSQHYRCNDCGRTKVAPGAKEQFIKGGRYDASIAVQVAVDKYSNHLPLSRQVKQFKRDGLRITSQTLWNQIDTLATYLEPHYLALHKLVLEEPFVHVDFSPWRMMKNSGGSKWWHLVSISHPEISYFQINPKRDHLTVADLLSGYEGIVIADGDKAIKKMERAASRNLQGSLFEVENPPDYLLAGCWTHARRPFFKAEKSDYPVGEVLDLIGELYSIESKAKTESGGDFAKLVEVRSRLRVEESQGIIDKIKVWRDKQTILLPGSTYSKGVTYLHNQWDSLMMFLKHPEIPIDNNFGEQQIRPTVLGKKNHYGSRSVRGSEVTAIFYTLLGTCERLGLNGFEYLMYAVQAAILGEVILPHQFKSWRLDMAAEMMKDLEGYLKS